jgi:hypothetical protein
MEVSMSDGNSTKPNPFQTPIHPAALLFPELLADGLGISLDELAGVATKRKRRTP